MKISIASDHAGFVLKEKIKTELIKQGQQVTDFGTYNTDSVDYPDFAHALCNNISEQDKGILICGSGNGVCITANKHTGVRAGLAWTPEVAKLLVMHNQAQIMCLPARFIPEDVAMACTESFLQATFEGGRHQLRVNKIEDLGY